MEGGGEEGEGEGGDGEGPGQTGEEQALLLVPLVPGYGMVFRFIY